MRDKAADGQRQHGMVCLRSVKAACRCAGVQGRQSRAEQSSGVDGVVVVR